METISSLGEFQLIQRLCRASETTASKGVVIGPGDDAAVVTVPRTQQLLTTTDTLLEDVHFRADNDPYLLGQKALSVNLSDIAAMAGQPRWYLLSLSLPSSTPLTWIDELARGLHHTAQQQTTGEVALIGGNMTRSQEKISITITLMGLIAKDRATSRHGAQVDDRIYVTGSIGDAMLGLEVIQGEHTNIEPEARLYLQKRHNLPQPPVALAMALQESALTRAAIDISDGLLADLQHLCQASKVGASIQAERIPLSQAAETLYQQHGKPLLSRLLTGGEDYELLFTAAASAEPAIMAVANAMDTRITPIGVITKETILILNHQGETMPVTTHGWKHF